MNIPVVMILLVELIEPIMIPHKLFFHVGDWLCFQWRVGKLFVIREYRNWVVEVN